MFIGGTTPGRTYYNVNYRPSGDLYCEHDVIYKEGLSPSNENTYISIADNTTSTYIYPSENYFNRSVGLNADQVKYISYNFKPTNMPVLQEHEVFVPVSYNSSFQYETASYVDFKLMPFDGSSDNTVCDNFHHRSHGLTSVGGYDVIDNQDVDLSGVFKDNSRRVFWDEDNLGIALDIKNWGDSTVGNYENGYTYQSSLDTISTVTEFYKVFWVDVTVSGYVEDRSTYQNLSIYGGDANLKTIKCKITKDVDSSSTWGGFYRHNNQVEVWSPFQSQLDESSYFEVDYFKSADFKIEGSNCIWYNKDYTNSGLFVPISPISTPNTSGIKSYDPYISTESTFLSGNFHSLTAGDDFSLFFREYSYKNSTLIDLVGGFGNVIIRTRIGNIISKAQGNFLTTQYVESAPIGSNMGTKNLIVNNTTDNTLVIYTYRQNGATSGVIENVTDYVEAATPLNILKSSNTLINTIHEFGISSGVLSLAQFNNFIEDKYYGSGVFDKMLDVVNPSGSTNFLSLNISGYRGEFSRNEEYYGNYVIVDNANPYSISEMNCPSYRRQIEIPEHEHLFLYNIEDWDNSSQNPPTFNLWCHNQSDTQLSGLILRSTLTLDDVVFHSDDVLIESTNEPQLISTQFRPRIAPTGITQYQVIDSATSGIIHFSFEAPKNAEPRNLDFKIYSTSIDIEGYQQPIDSNIPLYTRGVSTESSGLPLYVRGAIAATPSGVDLFISGMGYSENSLPLYVHNPTNKLIPSESGIPTLPLYMFAPSKIGDGSGIPLDLYIKGASGVVNSNIPLYINTYSSGLLSQEIPLHIGEELNYFGPDKILTLFMPNPSGTFFGQGNGDVTNNGQLPPNLQLYMSNFNNVDDSISLFVSGDGFQRINHGDDSNLTLYLESDGKTNASGIPLYLNTSGITNNFTPLYTKALNFDAGSMDLYLHRDGKDEKGLPLYLLNQIDNSGTVPLYLKGGLEDKSISLYMSADYREESGSIPLNIWSSTSSGLFNNSTLYINSEYFQPIPLFLQADPPDNSWKMPLYLDCEFNPADLTLFLYNNYLEEKKKTTLITKGDVPSLNSDITLYIERDSERMNTTLPLYLHSDSGIISSLNLFMDANYSIEDSINLVISGQGISSFSNDLYTHGF